MKLFVDIPNNYSEERDYILAVVLGEFLRLDYQVRCSNRRSLRITAADGLELVVFDHLFQTPLDSWLTEQSLPRQPLQTWEVPRCLVECSMVPSSVPVIYGSILTNGRFCQIGNESIELGLDIFGSCFYMLSRYEEVVKPHRDKHDRFPATASLAYQEGFLDRPIVNEYLEILWACMKRLWPQLQRGSRIYQVMISHDVDHPLSVAHKSWSTVLKSSGGDLLQRKDFSLALRRLYARLASERGSFDADPCNTFDFIMGISERFGLQGAFYFITDQSAGAIDGDYSIEMPWIRNLMQRIHARGHEIGLHPSYNTFRDIARTKREFVKLLNLMEKEGIKQSAWGGRQHYLRWDASLTWQIWADVGLCYDSTLTFADCVGFRCGVCYEFPTFNLIKRKRIHLSERPLIAMDRSLFSQEYMQLTPFSATTKIATLARTCKNYNGQFTLLWHNSELLTGWQKRLYMEVVESLT